MWEWAAIFEGHHPGYVLAIDPEQLKAYIAAQEGYWGDDAEITAVGALLRLLDCVTAGAMLFGMPLDCYIEMTGNPG